MNNKSFGALYATNLFGVMNDNFLKMLVCFVAVGWISDPDYQSLIVNVTPGALVLPYLFFSPLAGKLPQYYKKQNILRIAKLCEIPIMLIAIAGFYIHNVWLAVFAVVLMGLQSAIYSPSKYGLIKDIGGINGISEGMGGMEAIAFMGMLLGTVMASFMAESASPSTHYAVLLLLATFGVLCSLMIQVKEEQTKEDTSINPIKFILETSRMIRQHRGLPHVIHLLSLFWWLSASLQMILVVYSKNTLGLQAMETGIMLALTAIGITLGCVIGGKLDNKYHMIGYVPLIGIVMGILLFVVFFCELEPTAFTFAIVGIAFAGGLFKIPLDAEIQKRVHSSELNIALAYFNLVSFIYIFAASATNILVSLVLPDIYVFLVQGIVMMVSSILFLFDYKSVLCFFGRTHLHLHYRINGIGRENMDTDGETNLLILPMHRAVIDPIMLFSELYDKKMQPLVDENYFRIPGIGHILGIFDAIEVPDLKTSRRGVEKVRQLDDIVAKGLEGHDNILFYPSGHITTDGRETIGARHLAYNACRVLPTHTKVVAIKIKGLWGSQWSRYGLKATPSIVKLLIKSAGLIASGAIFFMKKRDITIEYVDITEDARKWANENTRVEFNKKLEEFYNEGEEGEKAIIL